jgi:hypothetical protein
VILMWIVDFVKWSLQKGVVLKLGTVYIHTQSDVFISVTVRHATDCGETRALATLANVAPVPNSYL